MKRIIKSVRRGFSGLVGVGGVVASTVCAVAQMPELKTLDPTFFDKCAPPEVVAMAILFKTHPELLDDPTYMRAFVMMNNCTPNEGVNLHSTFQLDTALKNEFQRPKIVDFYKSHAASILGALTIKPLQISVSGPTLKEYDAAQHAFPFNLKRDNGLPMDNVSVGATGWFTRGCGNDWMPAHFVFSPIFLKNVPASPEDAENYVTNVVKNRQARTFQIFLKMELGRAALDVATKSIVAQSTLDTITPRGVGEVARPAFGGPTEPPMI